MRSSPKSSSQIVEILHHIYGVKPLVFFAGHTIGAKTNDGFLPVIPDFPDVHISDTAEILGIGRSTTETLWISAEYSRNSDQPCPLVVLLNDTTFVRGSAKSVHEERNRLSERFKGKLGLPESYMKVLGASQLQPIGDGNELFWRESILRNRFWRLMRRKGNERIADLLLDRSGEHIKFRECPDLRYCSLSPDPSSITGGVDCIAEVMELMFELFGIPDEFIAKGQTLCGKNLLEVFG